MSCHLPVVEFAYDTWYQGGFPKTLAQQQVTVVAYIYVYICLFRFAGAVLFGMVFVLLVFVGGGGTAYLRYILPVVVQTHKIMHVEIIVFFSK